MGQESASYHLAVRPELWHAVVSALAGAGAEAGPPQERWLDMRLYAAHRYWIDLRLHRPPKSSLEVRIALTNDEWSVRGPLETAFAALPAGVAEGVLCGEDGAELGAPAAAEGWSRRLEDDYRARRARFVERVGDSTAPISADHVYLYVHQAGWHRDTDRARQWRREAEISRIEEMWDPPAATPQPPPDHPDATPPPSD
jgi:hypothetical protein